MSVCASPRDGRRSLGSHTGRTCWRLARGRGGGPGVHDGAAPDKVTKVPVEGQVTSGCANYGELYLTFKKPATLAQVDPATDKILKSWELPSSADSVAVYPIQKRAFLPLNGKINILDLESGNLTKT